MRRVVVIGAIGSGKTTLGNRVAKTLNLPYVDIDALDLLPGWEHRAKADFQARLSAEVSRETWVMGGDFARTAGPIVWPRADTIVWLDLPRALTLWRTVRRTVTQIRTREEVYPGCFQTARSAMRSGILGFALRHPTKKRRTHPPLLEQHRARGTVVLRLQTRADVEQWIRSIEKQRPPAGGPA